IMDRALIIQAKRQEWTFWPNRLDSDVTVQIDGANIPPTFTSERTKKLIRRFNKAATFPGGFSLDTVQALISQADTVIEEDRSLADKAYAEEIKLRVQADIFARTE